MEEHSLSESVEVEDWGGGTYSYRTLADLPVNEIQAHIAFLRALKTGVDPEPTVIQPYQ